MGRHAEGWRLRLHERTGIHFVRFRHNGRREEISTSRRDPTEASAEAARIYAEVVSGRWSPDLVLKARIGPPKPGTPLDEIGSLWVVDLEAELDELTADTYGGYISAHWQPFFLSLNRLVTRSVNDYIRARLKKVKRKTLLKELSALRRFCAWLFEKGFIREIPVIESPPSNVTGTPDKTTTHKAGPVEVSEREIAQFIAHLPAWSLGKNGKRKFRVREALEFEYETGLRTQTVATIIGADYIKETGKLRVRDETDKARWGRDLPLSERARKILDSVGAKDLEPFFGKASGKRREHHYREYRSHLVDRTADLRGTAYLLGHKEITTMNKYAKPTERAAERALQADSKYIQENHFGGNTGGQKARRRRA